MGRGGNAKIQQSGHTPRSGSEIATVVPKRARREAQIRDNPEGGELHLAKEVRRRCKKNSPSVLSCTDKRTKDWIVHSGRGGEGPVPLRKPRKSGKKKCERFCLLQVEQRVRFSFAMTEANGLGTSAEGSVATALGNLA